MSHSYRKDGPTVDTFTFAPDTRIFTVGGLTYTFPAVGSFNFDALNEQVQAQGIILANLPTGDGFNLPTADPEVAGALWNNAGIVTVSEGA